MASDAINYTYMDSPLGKILIAQNSVGLVYIDFPEGANSKQPEDSWQFQNQLESDVVEQLQAYFHGELTEFNLPLTPQGTEFQKKVWQTLQLIPYGQTMSYAEQAKVMGMPQASRAVGAANGKNPLVIVVPCHRVIGSNGKLTGFRGGIHMKEYLLALERNHTDRRMQR